LENNFSLVNPVFRPVNSRFLAALNYFSITRYKPAKWLITLTVLLCIQRGFGESMTKGVPLRLIESKNFEITVDPNELEYKTRKETVREYYGWVFLVESLKAKYYSLMGLGGLVVLAGIMFNSWFLLFLVPLIPLVLKAQFDYGDKLDDKNVWEAKFVTRVDGVGV